MTPKYRFFQVWLKAEMEVCATLIMAKAGIDPQLSRKRSEGAARSVTKRSFHSLRHFFNTAMAESGVPQELRRQLVGHTSNDVNDIYTHWKAEHRDRAVDSLPGL